MGRLAVAVTVILLVSAGGASAATRAPSYDRTPQDLYGGTYDGWGMTTTGAESNIRNRYNGVVLVKCVGGVMINDPADSSWVDGLSRYWDKLICAGYTARNHVFALIADAKGKGAWIIYRLRGVTIDGLRYG